jgi:hypothetical protein
MTAETPSLFPTDASTVTAPPKFQGWRRRRGGRWRIASTGQTEAEALTRMLDAARTDPPGSYDNLVLPYGDQP